MLENYDKENEWKREREEEGRDSESTIWTEGEGKQTGNWEEGWEVLDLRKREMRVLERNVEGEKDGIKQTMWKLVDWLFGCFWRFDLQDQAIILSLSLLKVYLRNTKVEKTKLQGIAITCLLISSKYTHSKFSLSDAILLSNNIFSSDAICQFQSQILILFNFQLEFPHIYKYFQILNQQKLLSLDQSHKLLFWIEVSMLQGLLKDMNQPTFLINLLNFVQNGIKSQQINRLVGFVKERKYQYIVKRWLSKFDVGSYLDGLGNGGEREEWE